MNKMTSIKKRCTKHKGMTVSFATENCPACLKDEQIKRLDIARRFLLAFIYWSLDYLRLSHYDGIDREEREHKLDKIYNEISAPSIASSKKWRFWRNMGKCVKLSHGNSGTRHTEAARSGLHFSFRTRILQRSNVKKSEAFEPDLVDYSFTMSGRRT